jgi:hypothetical protein
MHPCRNRGVVDYMGDPVRHMPARLLTPGERALVAEWLAMASDVALAYVSSRSSDDPALYHRIIIVTKPDDGPSHIVYAPSGRNIWIVFSSGRRSGVKRFQNLRTALNSIRPVLVEFAAENMRSEASPL